MSSISNVVFFDGAATPVSHTLVPIDVTREGGKVTANWRENLVGPAVYAQVRLRMSIERFKTGVYRVEQTIVIPVMESILNQNAQGYTAVPKVAYENTITMIGLFHERSDITGRRLVRQSALNIGGSVSTTVTPVTTGPLPELFDLLVAPT